MYDGVPSMHGLNDASERLGYNNGRYGYNNGSRRRWHQRPSRFTSPSSRRVRMG